MLHPLIRSRRPVARVILTASLFAATVPLACRSTAAVAADMPTKTAAASPPPYQTSAAGVIAGPGGTNPFTGSADLVLQVARAGVNFKF